MSGPWEEYQTQEDGPWSEYKKEGEKAPAPQSTPLSSVPGQALENLPGSAVRFGENIASAVVHPIETVKNISKIGAGGIEKAVGMVTDKFGKGQEEPAFDAFTKSIGDRYGGWENVKHTMATDPVGFMADISALLSGGATAAGKAGLPEAAAAARTGAEFTNPVSLTTKGVAAGANALSKTNWPETIMARTAKIPPGSLRDRERERVLRTLVRDEKIPLGRKTVSEMSTAIGELETGIDDAIKLATQRGAKADVTRVTAELETLKNKYKNRPDPEAYYNAIDAVKKDLIDHNFNDRMQITTNVPVQSPILGPNGQPMMTTKPVTANVPTGEMNLDRAHQLKKGIYQEVQDYYMKQQNLQQVLGQLFGQTV